MVNYLLFGAGKQTPWFVASTNFCGVNTTAVASFHLLTWIHWTWSWEAVRVVGSHNPIQAASSPSLGRRRHPKVSRNSGWLICSEWEWLPPDGWLCPMISPRCWLKPHSAWLMETPTLDLLVLFSGSRPGHSTVPRCGVWRECLWSFIEGKMHGRPNACSSPRLGWNLLPALTSTENNNRAITLWLLWGVAKFYAIAIWGQLNKKIFLLSPQKSTDAWNNIMAIFSTQNYSGDFQIFKAHNDGPESLAMF